MAAVVLGSTAAILYIQGAVERSAKDFLNDVFRKRWTRAFAFMSDAERAQLGFSQGEFDQFFQAFAQTGWPTNDRYVIEEQIPYEAPNAQVDTSWSTAGTRKFSVSFLRPDGATDFVTRLEFRHNSQGEWHPDVFQYILSIKRAMPNGHPAVALLAGMEASHHRSLDIYPLHQRTSLDELRRVIATHHGSYLRSDLQPLH